MHPTLAYVYHGTRDRFEKSLKFILGASKSFFRLQYQLYEYYIWLLTFDFGEVVPV